MESVPTYSPVDGNRNVILSVENVHAGYGKRPVLRGVSLQVVENEVLALFGDNGAGKSTLLKVVAGLLPPTEGRITFLGRQLDGLLPHMVQRSGIGSLLQGGRVFPNLTVSQNLAVARRHARDSTLGRPLHLGTCRTFSALEGRQNVRAGLLSGGERQILAIDIVLAQDPLLLLLDEPSAGLAPLLVGEVADRLAAFASTAGRGVILIEQNVDFGRRLANRSLTLTNCVMVCESHSGANNEE